jgi:galactokinase
MEAETTCVARISKLREEFRRRFLSAPRVFRAPGRINIIGEHTDYTGGLVMPAAIDRWCNVAIAANNSRHLTVRAVDLGADDIVDLDALRPRGGWMDYVAGVASVLMRADIAVPGADIMITGDVPMGAGLGSSAALEVAVTRAFTALAGVEATGEQIAKWARAAENDFVGMPCGIMDQFASANGRADHALLLDCADLTVKHVPLPKHVVFLIVDSMIKHAHVDGEYRARRADCDAAVKLLGVASLRDVDIVHLPREIAKLPERVGKRARHVVTESMRVVAAETSMRKGDANALGGLLNQSHISLRDDMEISIPEVDALVTIAQKTQGVLGARLMGGGFGGSIIAAVRAEAADAARTAIVEQYGTHIGKTPSAFVCRAVDGAGEVT